mmetsp:Transcript_37216/g.69446  ORF Transcript_37216/g.69446 Transcript_37216/m.69446 type:complete len:201 (-) Transcript_37216:890-1492(-)
MASAQGGQEFLLHDLVRELLHRRCLEGPPKSFASVCIGCGGKVQLKFQHVRMLRRDTWDICVQLLNALILQHLTEDIVNAEIAQIRFHHRCAKPFQPLRHQRMVWRGSDKPAGNRELAGQEGVERPGGGIGAVEDKEEVLRVALPIRLQGLQPRHHRPGAEGRGVRPNTSIPLQKGKADHVRAKSRGQLPETLAVTKVWE